MSGNDETEDDVVSTGEFLNMCTLETKTKSNSQSCGDGDVVEKNEENGSNALAGWEGMVPEDEEHGCAIQKKPVAPKCEKCDVLWDLNETLMKEIRTLRNTLQENVGSIRTHVELIHEYDRASEQTHAELHTLKQKYASVSSERDTLSRHVAVLEKAQQTYETKMLSLRNTVTDLQAKLAEKKKNNTDDHDKEDEAEQVEWAFDETEKGKQTKCVFSPELEQGYQNYRKNAQASMIMLTGNGNKYEINFKTLEQKNLATGTIRKLHRLWLLNPKHHREIPLVLQNITHFHECAASEEPRCVDLSLGSDEWTAVADAFMNSCSVNCQSMKAYGKTILTITKVVHPYRALIYELKKKFMKNKSEMMLFHGSAVDSMVLAKQGLDLRVGKEGYLGKAIYGSVNPFYSEFYTDQKVSLRSMLYVKFLTGIVQQVPKETAYQRPPEGIDSITMEVAFGYQGTKCSNQIYAVYDNAQSYIGYIINYS